MGLGVSILLVAAGAILAWAVNADVSGVNIHTIGYILLIVGIVGAVLSMIFWSSWAGPGYWSRRRGPGYVDEGPPPYWAELTESPRSGGSPLRGAVLSQACDVAPRQLPHGCARRRGTGSAHRAE